nr:hypothetical protein CFP56_42056 [Quercus suber]
MAAEIDGSSSTFDLGTNPQGALTSLYGGVTTNSRSLNVLREIAITAILLERNATVASATSCLNQHKRDRWIAKHEEDRRASVGVRAMQNHDVRELYREHKDQVDGRVVIVVPVSGGRQAQTAAYEDNSSTKVFCHIIILDSESSMNIDQPATSKTRRRLECGVRVGDPDMLPNMDGNASPEVSPVSLSNAQERLVSQTRHRRRRHQNRHGRSHCQCLTGPRRCLSCRDLGAITITNVIDKKQKLAHKQLFFALMLQITEVRSPATYRTGLMTAFIDSYYPRALEKGLHEAFDVWHWMSPRSPVMTTARDAFVLGGVGRCTGQAALLLESRRKHVQAIQLLRQEIAKPGGLRRDSVLGAAYHVAQCELWKSTASPGCTWGSHMDGVEVIIRARGPDAMTTPFASTLLHLLRTISASNSLLNRKASFFAEPQWIEVVDHSSPGAQLIDIGLQMGALLERSDSLRAMQNAKEYEIIEVLKDVTKLLHQLQDWLLDSYKDLPDDRQPYRLVSASNFREHTILFGDLVDVFPKVFDVPSYVSAASHGYVWMYMLLLREAIHGLARQHAYPLVRGYNQDAVLTAEIDETAANLCQCVPYLLAEQNQTMGTIISVGPLYFALNWFKQRHDLLRARWCEHGIHSIQQGEVLSGVYDTALNLARPMICWWMLPDVVDRGIPDIDK